MISCLRESAAIMGFMTPVRVHTPLSRQRGDGYLLVIIIIIITSNALCLIPGIIR